MYMTHLIIGVSHGKKEMDSNYSKFVFTLSHYERFDKLDYGKISHECRNICI